MSLASKMKGKMKSKAVSNEPLWKGPEVDGITQSMLGRFLVCRERFRLMVIEGLGTEDTFSHRLEYGQMWHACEESHAANEPWGDNLLRYTKELLERYRLQQEQIEHWYNVCRVQFPVYVDYWSKNKDVRLRKPIYQEEVFDVPYTLPSGRIVKLRGKWDSVDIIGKGKASGVYLQENKTKGEIIEEQLRKQLFFDLQTGFYLTALAEKGYKPAGVRYNVVRRPLAGGKHSIRQLKPTKANPGGEGKKEYYNRLGGLIASEPEYFFMRWKVDIVKSDLDRYKQQFLNPILEQLYDWWEWVAKCKLMGVSPWGVALLPVHWRTPYGIFNPLAQGGGTDLDDYLETGSEVGLVRKTRLFGELQ